MIERLIQIIFAKGWLKVGLIAIFFSFLAFGNSQFCLQKCAAGLLRMNLNRAIANASNFVIKEEKNKEIINW